jgi:hypothetical protein
MICYLSNHFEELIVSAQVVYNAVEDAIDEYVTLVAGIFFGDFNIFVH